MRLKTVTGSIAVLGLIAGIGNAALAKPSPTAVSGVLTDATGGTHGRVSGKMLANSLVLTVNARGLSQGTHGLHIHAVGKCEGPAFASAGGHLNPAAKMHGRDNPMGAHMGDLPNLEIGANGRGKVRLTIAGTVEEIFDADGASVVIHAAADDYKTDPSGNAGARLVCAVLTRG